MRIGNLHMIVGAALLVAIAAACTSSPTSEPSAPPETLTPHPALTPAENLAPENPVSSQGAIREAIAAARTVLENDETYRNVTPDEMKAVAADLSFVTKSKLYNEVSFQVRGESSIAFASMSPSGACFGAVDDGEAFSYSHTDVGQTSCDAADVPYPTAGW